MKTNDSGNKCGIKAIVKLFLCLSGYPNVRLIRRIHRSYKNNNTCYKTQIYLVAFYILHQLNLF